MSINSVPERGTLADKDGYATPSWREFFASIFAALFGWKRSYTRSAALDFPLIAAAGEASLTVSVIGARVGDAVIVTPDAKTAGIIDNYGLVTANDVVSVFAHNFTAGGINPVSKNYRVVVLQQ